MLMHNNGLILDYQLSTIVQVGLFHIDIHCFNWGIGIVDKVHTRCNAYRHDISDVLNFSFSHLEVLI
jgi:hypothetical protein